MSNEPEPPTRRRQLVLLGLLYVAQALPLGFFVVALPAILRDRGVSLERCGFSRARLDSGVLVSGS